MKISQLKEIIRNLPDNCEVVVHSDSHSRDYQVLEHKIKELASRYFAGDDLESTEDKCLVLETY